MTSSKTPGWLTILKLDWRLLTFRATRDELLSMTGRHLVFGLVCAWIVGIGRYWGNSRVGFLQHLGIGSVIYVFVFALFLWLVIWPLRPQNWSYLRVATFISLVSPPAILYAIPVENFFSIRTADAFNARFLLIVAVWRVALLIFFLRRVGELDVWSIIVGTFLPLTFIIVGLTTLNLEKAVFSFMGGFSEHTANDAAFATLWTLSIISILLFVPLLIGYAVLLLLKATRRRTLRINENEND